MKLKLRAIPLLAFTIGFILFTSCRVSLIPNYDAALSEEINNTAKGIDQFYLSMVELTSADSNGRSYQKFAEKYVEIDVELNSLWNKNKIKPLNENSTRICEITVQLWEKYMKEHKTKNTLSDGLIKLNRKTFSDLFYAMQVAENAKQIIGNPPQ